jgi:hypothetical protein
MARAMDMVVVAAPATAAEAEICFNALMEADFRPIAGYQGGAPGAADGPTPTSYPVLVPKTEFEGAQAVVRALKAGAPQKDRYESVKTSDQLKRGLGALLVMALVVVGCTAVVMLVQSLGGLLHHPG